MKIWFLRVVNQTVFTLALQIVAAVTGIAIVRYLQKDAYAAYVLAFAIASMIGGIADGGVSGALMTHGARHPDDKWHVARLRRTAITFRRKTNHLTALMIFPIGLWLMWRLGMSWQWALLIVSAATAASYSVAASGMALVTLRLRYEFSFANSISLGSAVLRGILIAPLVFFPGLESTLFLILILGLLSIAETRVALRGEPSVTGTTDREFLQLLRANRRKFVPTHTFLLLQGQFLTYALAAAGNNESLAELAALSRYSLVLSAASSVLVTCFTPLFARQSSVRRLLAVLTAAATAYSLGSCCLVLFFYLESDWFLSLLGPSYAGLGQELLLVNIGAAITGVGNIFYGANVSRSWFDRIWLFIPLSVATIGALTITVGFDTISSAATFTMLLSVPGLLSAAYCTFLGARPSGKRSVEA